VALFTKPQPGMIKFAGILLVALLIPSTIVTVIFGTDVGMAFSLSAGLGMAIAPVADTQSAAGSAAIAGMLAGLATIAHEDPGQVAALMVLAALLMALTNQVSAGLMTLAPVIVILFGPGPVDEPWLTSLFWVFAGGLLGIAVARLFKFQAARRPVPAGVAWRHAIVIAVLGAGTMYWALYYQIPHGYWVTVTIVIGLRPLPEERSDTLRGRLLGTLLGAVIALAAILIGNVVLGALVALICLYLLTTYALGGSYFMQTLFMTPMLLVFASLGDLDKGLQYTGQRVFYTVVGALIGIVAAVGLSRFDRSEMSATSAEVPTAELG
jgi:uncharacterized membrane protein YccC